MRYPLTAMETHTLDASKEPLGRMASKAAMLLMGKHRQDFLRHRSLPVRVEITNADRIVLTGKKWERKAYYRHSGYLGHLKTSSARELAERNPAELVRRAVSGMLPKNKLRKQMMKRLIIYLGTAPSR